MELCLYHVGWEHGELPDYLVQIPSRRVGTLDATQLVEQRGRAHIFAKRPQALDNDFEPREVVVVVSQEAEQVDARVDPAMRDHAAKENAPRAKVLEAAALGLSENRLDRKPSRIECAGRGNPRDIREIARSFGFHVTWHLQAEKACIAVGVQSSASGRMGHVLHFVVDGLPNYKVKA